MTPEPATRILRRAEIEGMEFADSLDASPGLVLTDPEAVRWRARGMALRLERVNGLPTSGYHGAVVVRHDDFDRLKATARAGIEALDILGNFVDDDECSLDHHGYCQTHLWLGPGRCHVARARDLLARTAPSPTPLSSPQSPDVPNQEVK